MRRLLAWIQGFAESLGGPGLFVIAYLDSSFLSFPQVCDALIVLLTVRHPERMLFYATVTTLGSVAGCYSLYVVGRKGGEAFLRKRFHDRHVDNALSVFRRHGIPFVRHGRGSLLSRRKIFLRLSYFCSLEVPHFDSNLFKRRADKSESGDEVGVPIPLLPDLLAAIASVAAAYEVEIPVVAHAGDGNTHPIIVYDAADPGSEKRAREAFGEVMARAIALGGTITGEHGVGRTKKGALPDQLGPDVMELSRRVKEALDPDGILNPGAVL